MFFAVLPELDQIEGLIHISAEDRRQRKWNIVLIWHNSYVELLHPHIPQPTLPFTCFRIRRSQSFSILLYLLAEWRFGYFTFCSCLSLADTKLNHTFKTIHLSLIEMVNNVGWNYIGFRSHKMFKIWTIIM